MKQSTQDKYRIMHDYIAYGVPAVEEPSGNGKNRMVLLCFLSLLIHAIVLQAMVLFAPMDFARPVVAGQIINVDLTVAKAPTAQPELTPKSDQHAPPPVHLISEDGAKVPAVTSPLPDNRRTVEQKTESLPTPPSNTIGTKVNIKNDVLFSAAKIPSLTFPVKVNLPARLMSLPPPIRQTDEFFGHKHEKLAYQISMYGIQIGDARFEATNDNGELRISSRVKFNESISLVYPLDIETETRMFNGRYIMTTIKRHDGNRQTDVGFTICLGEKNVLWVDRLNKRYYNTSVPTDQVMDVITGFYFLRNQQLEVGKSLTLDLFANDTYAKTPVQVLRKERIRLPNLTEVEAFVVQPRLATSGIFDKSGDLFIWLTADENRVPVKLETSIPLGRITAELVSAVSE